jgi:hypothetical protein
MSPWYVRRIFNDGITSCGGPWETEDQARYMASHVGPANGMGVAVLSERDDPVATKDRPLLLASQHRGGPGLRVVIGPFESREHIAEFIAAALGADFRGLPMADATDWQLVALDGGEETKWPPDVS